MLPQVPLYYECKLGLLCWLLFSDGADTVYRKFRRFLVINFGSRFVATDEEIEQTQLEMWKSECPQIVDAALARDAQLRVTRAGGALSPSKTHLASDWEEEFSAGSLEVDTCPTTGRAITKPGTISASESVYAVSHFLLSAEGGAMLAACDKTESQKAVILERAAAEVPHPSNPTRHPL